MKEMSNLPGWTVLLIHWSHKYLLQNVMSKFVEAKSNFHELYMGRRSLYFFDNMIFFTKKN